MKITKRIQEVNESVTLAISARAKALKKQGKDVISFGAGEPDFDTPDFIKNAAKEALDQGFTKYTPASGIPELKQAIVNKLKRDNKLDYDASQIVISCGAKHSLYNIMQVIAEEGDEVIIPAPAWLSYPEMVKLASATPVLVETKEENGFKLTADELKKAITKNTRAIVLNSPSNPTGMVYSEDELKSLAAVLENEDIIVISDEIYEFLMYDGLKHVSIASLSKKIKEHTIVVNGVSKSHSMTGWRIGYIAAPIEIAKGVSKLQSQSTSNPTSIAQKAALAAISADLSSVKEMVKVFAKRRDLMVERISKIDKLTALKPEGAFYVFVNIKATGLNSMDFAKKILEDKLVAVIPGKPFGSDDHVRLSFAISEDEINKGLDRVKEFVENA